MKNKLAVAIVGSRQMTKRGEKLARQYSSFLAKNGITIVSGLARGIDTVAHRAALDVGGKTIAVLGSGIDIIYPPENRKLAEEIKKHGELISPFPKGTKPFGKNFLARNRIIVDLSDAVLVIEGKARSGTISTANWAADAGKEVFAIPGSEATDYLIENGANIANSPDDILNFILSCN
jgi:DNA processing protein